MADASKKLVTLDLLTYFKGKMDESVDKKIEAIMITVGEEGNLYIHGKDTGIPATALSIDIEYIQGLFAEEEESEEVEDIEETP